MVTLRNDRYSGQLPVYNVSRSYSANFQIFSERVGMLERPMASSLHNVALEWQDRFFKICFKALLFSAWSS
jgi:hypothetical protein